MITTRSETSSASSWSWVTNTLVTCTSSCSRRSQRRSSFRTLASSAPNGSSSSSTLGLTASARARATRWRWPPDSSEGRRWASTSSCTSLSRPITVSRISSSEGRTARGPDPESEGDVLEDAHVAEQGVVLEHEPDLALAHRLGGRVLAVEVDRALIGRLQPGDDPEQRGLARSGGPEQRHQLAARHVEAHVVEGDEVAERLAQMADLDAHAAILSGGESASARSAAARRCCHSTRVLSARVTKASRVSTEATAKLAAKAYSL